MRRLVLLAAVLAASAGFLAWWFSPGQIVKRRTRHVLDLLTLDAGTPATNRMLGTFSLGRLLDDPVALDLPSASEANGSFSRQDLEAGFIGAGGYEALSSTQRVDHHDQAQLAALLARVRSVAGLAGRG